MISYLRSEAKRIVEDDKLRILGLILCAIHLLTFFFWRNVDLKDIVCSPLIPFCTPGTAFLREINRLFLYGYAGLAVLSGVFLFLRKPGSFWWSFFFLSLMKLLYHLSDYRLMGNYHYIAHLMNLIFLFGTQKLMLTRIMIVLVYVSAGLLKFNTDWLSGAVIPGSFFASGKLLEWGMAWVLLLELGLSPLLLGKNHFFKWAVWGQLVLFHLMSWQIVGYFYPSLMLLLLSVFFLDQTPVSLRFHLVEKVCLGTFLALQLLTLVLFPTSSLDGEGRIISLNMFDAFSECRTNVFLRFRDKVIEYNPGFGHYSVRLQCDPILLVHHLQKTCEDQKHVSGFADADLGFQVKRFSGTEIPVARVYRDICTKPLTLGPLGQVRQE